MSNWTNEDTEAAIAKVMEKASTDPAFRDMALSDPAGAVKAASGKDLPDGFNLRMVSNEGADLTLVLPDPASEELSDADLDAVSGGRCKSVSSISIGYCK